MLLHAQRTGVMLDHRRDTAWGGTVSGTGGGGRVSVPVTSIHYEQQERLMMFESKRTLNALVNSYVNNNLSLNP